LNPSLSCCFIAGAATAAVLACATGAIAQSYPAKPVRLIVPVAQADAPASSEQGSRLRDATDRDCRQTPTRGRANLQHVFKEAAKA